jgi:hypothetical protein
VPHPHRQGAGVRPTDQLTSINTSWQSAKRRLVVQAMAISSNRAFVTTHVSVPVVSVQNVAHVSWRLIHRRFDPSFPIQSLR